VVEHNSSHLRRRLEVIYGTSASRIWGSVARRCHTYKKLESPYLELKTQECLRWACNPQMPMHSTQVWR
ncbi:hypothetical protein HAX54_023728, partial [Datura stramonium]|nr:hypothetical protein [Datura stramonium]